MVTKYAALSGDLPIIQKQPDDDGCWTVLGPGTVRDSCSQNVCSGLELKTKSQGSQATDDKVQ